MMPTHTSYTRKALPHNLETERALLGGLMTASCYVETVAATLTAADFGAPRHAQLFALILEQHRRYGTADIQTIEDEASGRGILEDLGGITYLLGLSNACPSVVNVPVYASRVADCAIQRRLKLAALGIVEQIESGSSSTPQLLDDAERAVFAVALAGRPPQDWASVADLAPARHAAILERARHPDAVGTTTGFIDLDRKLSGWQSTDLVVLAGRPAMGKTALALNFAAAAARTGVVVGLFSLEMSSGQVVERLLCSAGPLDAQRARSGRLVADDVRGLDLGAERIAGLPIEIDDTSGLTISSLRSKARRLRARCPSLGLIIVDYLQLMQGEGARETRETVISGISRGLKLLAKDLGVPVIALSQLNRQVEARMDKRPMMSDLRESGAIEQDADVVLLLYRDEVYNPESREVGTAEVIVAKQRAGETGTVRLAFAGEHQLFRDLTTPARAGQPTWRST